jgi:hypothetical protein
VTADALGRAVGEPSLTALDRLCSLPASRFADQVWSRQAWLSRAADLPGAGEVFSVQAVDELLSRRGLRTPFVRVAKDGRVVAPARFTGSGGAGATVGDQVRDDAVLGLLADGSTVVLQGLHRTWPPVGSLAADLAAQLGHPVQVNAYVTPPQSQGFAPHYDTHDVFVLQVHGRKRWVVHAPVLPDALPDEPWEQRRSLVQARADEPPLLDVVLEPGDCLYLPRGFVHAASALGGTTVHLTFGIHPTTERDVARTLLDSLGSQVGRASLPAGWDPTGPGATDVLAGVRDRLVRGLQQVDLVTAAQALHDARSARQRPEPVSPVAQASAAAVVTPTTVVRLRRHLGQRVEPDAAGGCVLVLADRRLAVSPEELPAVRRLLEGETCRVSDLPGDAAGLVARLLREGVLVPDPATAASG